MSLTAAFGGITLSKERFAQTLAACTSFQDFVTTDPDNPITTAEAALARIYFDYLPEPEAPAEYEGDELQLLFPCALLCTPSDRFGYILRSRADFVYDDGGSLILNLYRAVPADVANDVQEARRLFEILLEKILSDPSENKQGLAQLCGPDSDAFEFNQISVIAPFRVSDAEKVARGDYFQAQLLIDWGVR